MSDKQVLEKLLSFTKRLQATNKKKEKAAIISEAKEDIDKKLFLKFILDPKIITGLSKAKINRSVAVKNDTYRTFTDVCGYLNSHNTGRDEDIALVQKYFNDSGEEYREFLTAVFTKNLPIGVEAKTVNQILGEDIVKEWQVQQGYPLDKVKLKDNIWFSLSRKENGNRGTFYKGEIISRQAQVFHGLEHIKNDLMLLCNNDRIVRDATVFDGELIYKNPEGLSDGEVFRYGTGVLNSNDKDKTCIKFVIFDIIPLEEFDGESFTTYKVRREWLNQIRSVITRNNLKNIEVVPMVYEGNDKNVISQWLDYAVVNGWEGLMLNTSVPYKRARHNGCLKIKRFYTLDLRVTSIEEGQNRLTGTMGALVVDYKGNELRIGSGFDDNMRKLVWENKDLYIGRIVEVKYKEKTKNKDTGLESLQFPTFVRFREDKDEVSYG